MAKPKTMYSIKGVFTSLFEDSDKDVFLIPTYQRGYKWTSFGEESEIEVLMKDLFNAYSRGGGHRCYLQFITLKENNRTFEVIDGQQRLTTITILLSVIHSFKKIKLDENFVVNKLIYKVRDNFIKQFIYENITLILSSENWETFLENNQNSEIDVNNQDVYFIFHATHFINNFLKNKLDEIGLKNFYQYVCDQVFLVVNILGKEMDSEKVFINVNKGIKLKDEDLIKALLITQIPLENNYRQYRITENEINEIRSNIGRQWDEISNWASRQDIKDYFKKNHNTEEILGWLIRLSFNVEEKKNKPYPLFNYINNILRDKQMTAFDVFNKIRESMLILDDWFSKPEISNLLGYILHSSENSDIHGIWSELQSKNITSEVLIKLKTKTKKLLPVNSETGNLNELNYEDHRSELFRLFLMLDVSKFLPINNQPSVAYNFRKISSENWSIEHIFPQNAKEFKSIGVLLKEDLDLLKELLPNDVEDLGVENNDDKNAIINVYNKIKKSQDSCIIETNERGYLTYLVEKKASDLHRLGNLALLQDGMNAGLSNHYFDGKRKIIAQKVSSGEFVPYHTYDVFSKLVIPTNTGLHVWSKEDIHVHENYVSTRINNIYKYLNLAS